MQTVDFNALLQAVPMPALLIGTTEQIVGANDRARALLGGALTGRHFITALRQPNVLDAIEGAMRDRDQRTTRYLSSDGAQDTTFIVTASYVEFSGEVGVLVCLEDITHLEQADQMRRDFVANVSHELRTPLTALLGFIETLQGPAKDDMAAQKRFLTTMHHEASRMERLVRDLLSLSRVEGQERMRPKDMVDLGALLKSVCHTLRPLTESAAVEVVLDLPDDGISVPGDSDQLRQVITNLLENALKYGGAGKRVDVTLHLSEAEPALRGPGAVIAVTDQGPGIDPQHMPRLTERFYRVDSHRSREMGGTGLGLAIVKHIVNRHRGRLRIDSKVGKGSTFKVLLPAAPQ
ncbi:two-component sensor histidine kinase [Pseudohalocynthiibacter aestuariivivens]|nr:ATP-binding protein [Pseudohalocynthiibacter aestuariivivens]QIE44506.1 two-component sensor histidine kinase [Pseudohalocynthiibacter aestuariivivens]